MAALRSAREKNSQSTNGDERYKNIDRELRRLRYEKDALLEVLNSAQELFGYLPEELLSYISRQLNVPLSRVYGVATFYHMCTFEPLGEHTCIICTGTACHVKDSERIIEAISKTFNIPAGGTTPEGLFSLTTARCLGSCGLAPVVVLDGQVRGKETPESVTKRVQEIIAFSRDERTEGHDE